MVLRSGLWVLRVHSEGAQEGAPTGCLSLAVISGGSPLVTLLLECPCSHHWNPVALIQFSPLIFKCPHHM